MRIELNNVSKRFGYDWIFRNINLSLSSGNIYGLKGPNGSGKSTLMQIFSGHLSPSDGKIEFFNNDQLINISSVYKEVSFAGPYIDLIHQYTLTEILDFHFKFKKSLVANKEEMIQLIGLQKAKDKQLVFYSSGMRQRVKLALALFSDTKILLLDEPSTNLDAEGILWYQNMLERFAVNRLTMVASNETRDYKQATELFDIMDYKQVEKKKLP